MTVSAQLGFDKTIAFVDDFIDSFYSYKYMLANREFANIESTIDEG